MSLIATNKVSAYIDQHPDARVPLLSWLKEYPYYHEKRMFYDQDGTPYQGNSSGQMGVGRDDYFIKARINYAAKTICITWIGNKEEHQIKLDKELEGTLQKHPDAVVKKITIKAPVPQLKSFLVTSELDEPVSIYSLTDLPEGVCFQTAEEYEQALARAIFIFDSKPNTPEFEELSALIPLIKHFENKKLRFPSIHNFETVKLKMDMLDMIPQNLAHIAENEDRFNLFLAGKLSLSEEIVNRLFKFLFIRFPVNDRRFN